MAMPMEGAVCRGCMDLGTPLWGVQKSGDTMDAGVRAEESESGVLVFYSTLN